MLLDVTVKSWQSLPPSGHSAIYSGSCVLLLVHYDLMKLHTSDLPADFQGALCS